MEPLPHGCFLPLNSVAIHPQGFPHFCLNSTLKTGASLAELDLRRAEVHAQLAKGVWPDSCSRCHNKEKKGIHSRRTRTWERKIRMYGRQAAEAMMQESAPRVRHLEISFSNLCNLSCAMCSSEFSTGWAAADRAAMEKGLSFRDFTKPFQRVSRISPELIEEILARAEEFDNIIIKGGEPTRDPACLNFLRKLAERRKRPGLSLFIQTNGTRHPKEWALGLRNLELEVGVSLDGWGPVNDWIRGGSSFEKVISHLEILAGLPFVTKLTIDFTLSAFNVFHLPEFLSEVSALRARISKPFTCPVFQWAQQPFANPLSLKTEDRLAVLEICQPLLAEGGEFFVNSDGLKQTLALPRSGEESVRQTRAWLEHLSELRGFPLPKQEKLVASLS